jgi:hypothetical protein
MCLSILHGQVDFGIIPWLYVRIHIIKVMVYYVYVFIYLGHPNLHTSFHLSTFFNMILFLSNNSPPKQYASQLNMNVAWMFLQTTNNCIIEQTTRFENRFVKESSRQFLTFLSNHKWFGQINEHVPCTCLTSSCLDNCSLFLRNFILAYWKRILSILGDKHPNLRSIIS